MDIGDGVHKKPTKSPIYSKSLLVEEEMMIGNKKMIMNKNEIKR